MLRRGSYRLPMFKPASPPPPNPHSRATTVPSLPAGTDRAPPLRPRCSSPPQAGTAIAQLLPAARGAGVAAMLPVPAFDAGRHLVMLTRGGMIKRTPLEQFSKARLCITIRVLYSQWAAASINPKPMSLQAPCLGRSQPLPYIHAHQMHRPDVHTNLLPHNAGEQKRRGGDGRA